jgi:hypothetical protein
LAEHQRTKRRQTTLAGKYRPESEQVIHDRRAANDNIPLNARIAPVQVDDPYALLGEPNKIIAIRSLRDDPLGWLHSHRRINDAQLAAGRCWERDYEQSAIGGTRTNFPRHERVDGGRVPDVFTGTVLAASRRVKRANKAIAEELGDDHVALVHDVLALGMSFKQVAAACGDTSEDALAAVSREFRAALDVLAAHYGSRDDR